MSAPVFERCLSTPEILEAFGARAQAAEGAIDEASDE